MSVQLIVYPQSYEGIANAFSGNPTEAIVNGINFLGLDNTGTYTTASATPYVDTLTNAPPSIINTWYRFRKNTGVTPAFPTVSAGDLILESGGVSITGVYQQLSNLIVGQLYIVTINIVTPVSGGTVVVGAYNGATIQGGYTSYSSNVTQISKMFLAAAPQMNIMISYSHPAALNLEISSISSLPIGTQTADPIVSDGQAILDLYEDEDLPLTLSVDDFKNVAEKVQSYSKAFNLPATKRNNKIFNQVFDVTRSDDGVIFNVYKKTKCVLKQDGFVLFEGYLRLLDVTDKGQEISYNVNLYSEVIALADYLKDSDFRALDFTELTHDYNKTEIINSWNDSGTGIAYTNANTSGFRDAYKTVKYPFVNWNNQIVVSDGTRGTSGNPELTSLEQVFRPFIQVKYLIDRIFEPTPFTYESVNFGTEDFGNLYMDFNWGADNVPSNVTGSTYSGQAPYSADIFLLPIATSSYQNLQLANYQNNAWVTPPNYNQSTNILTATQLNETYQINYDYQINCSAGDTVEFQWLHTTSSGTNVIDFTSILSVTSINYWVGSFNIVMQTGDTLQAQFKTNGANTWQYSTFASTVNFIKSISAVTSQGFLQTLRGETGQWEFLKGLITMFNLITTPDKDNPNNIIIEPYVDVFMNNTDTPLQWTDKIDVSEMKLTPLADLNKRTIFKFVEDDDDFAFTNYKNQVGGHLYGSKKFNAGNEFNILEGLNEVIAEPFAATVVKPLMSQYPQLITPAIYAYNSESDTSEGFENSPRILYNNGIKNSGTTYYIPAQNGVAATDTQVDYLQFSHIKDGGTSVSSYKDFHFGLCQLLGNQASTLNNLFNLYWLPYYSELYNPNTRIMTIKVNLTPADINTFKFSDTVQIKNRTFRVNKIDYKPNDLATVEFILIP